MDKVDMVDMTDIIGKVDILDITDLVYMLWMVDFVGYGGYGWQGKQCVNGGQDVPSQHIRMCIYHYLLISYYIHLFFHFENTWNMFDWSFYYAILKTYIKTLSHPSPSLTNFALFKAKKWV